MSVFLKVRDFEDSKEYLTSKNLAKIECDNFLAIQAKISSDFKMGF